MKHIILALALVFGTQLAFAEAETKKSCTITKDAKTQKSKEVCKTIKVHKKLEGTTIPDKKAK